MTFESMHNYYEHLVIEYILDTLVAKEDIRDENYLEDLACLALNRLPPRYVRHDVDMAFFLTAQDSQQMQNHVEAAVEQAAEQLAKRRAQQSEQQSAGG